MSAKNNDNPPPAHGPSASPKATVKTENVFRPVHKSFFESLLSSVSLFSQPSPSSSAPPSAKGASTRTVSVSNVPDVFQSPSRAAAKILGNSTSVTKPVSTSVGHPTRSYLESVQWIKLSRALTEPLVSAKVATKLGDADRDFRIIQGRANSLTFL
jgi:hypothetical protein